MHRDLVEGVPDPLVPGSDDNEKWCPEVLQSTWNSQNKEEIRKDYGIKLGLDTSPLHDTKQISTTLALTYLFLYITTFFPISSPHVNPQFLWKKMAIYTGFQQSQD